MTATHVFIIGILVAWLAGIRVYLTVFGMGVAGALGWLDLPNGLDVAQSPWVIGVSGLLAGVEFFADKIPGVDTGWDLLHTLLRIPAGAFLAASAISTDGNMSGGMLAAGAGAALTSHTLKTATRGLLNTSPEPVSNWTASATEDMTTIGGLALIFAHPEIAAVVVTLATVLMAVLLWWLWKKISALRDRLNQPINLGLK